MALTADQLSDSQKKFAAKIGDEAVKQGVDPDFAIAKAYQDNGLTNFSTSNIGVMKKYLDIYKDPSLALIAIHDSPRVVDKYLKTNDINALGEKGKNYILDFGKHYDLGSGTGLYTPPTTALGAFGHAVERAVVPMAAMIPAAGAGAEAGMALGPVGAVVGGIGGALLGGTAAEKAQEAVLEAHPQVAKNLGIDEAQAAQEAAQHPYAQFAGTLLPNLAVMRPSGALLKSAEGLGEKEAAALAAEKKSAVVNAAINSAITGGLEAANEAGSNEPFDPTKLLMASALGLTGQKETNLGRTLAHLGEAPVAKLTGSKVELLRRPPEAEVSTEKPPVTEPVTTKPIPTTPAGASQDIGGMLGELEGKPITPDPSVYGEPKPVETPTPPVEAAPAPEAPVAEEPVKPIPKTPTGPIAKPEPLNFDKAFTDYTKFDEYLTEKGTDQTKLRNSWNDTPLVKDGNGPKFGDLPLYLQKDLVDKSTIIKAPEDPVINGKVDIPNHVAESVHNQFEKYKASSTEAEWNKLSNDKFKELPSQIQSHLDTIRHSHGELTPENVEPVLKHVEYQKNEYIQDINKPKGDFVLPNDEVIRGKMPSNSFNDLIKKHDYVGDALDTVINHLKTNGGEEFGLSPEHTEAYTHLAEQLKGVGPVNKVPLHVTDYHIGMKKESGRVGGEYFPLQNKLHVHGANSANDAINTFMHETMHAATVHGVNEHVQIYKAANGKIVSKGLTPLGRDFVKVLEASRKGWRRGSKQPYGNSNVYELISEGFSKKDFIRHLSSQPSVLNKSKYATLWDDFKSLIKRALKLPENTPQKTLFDDLMSLSGEVTRGKDFKAYADEKKVRGLSSVQSFGDVNYKGNKPPEPTWEHPLTNATDKQLHIDKFIHALQDNQLDAKNIEKAIKAAGHKIESRFSPYEKEQTFHGRVATKIREFLLGDVMPAVKAMEKEKITPAEINEYMHNRHAEERNEQMNKINPDTYHPNTGELIQENPLKDQGSGIHTQDARKYLAELDPKKREALERVAKHFDEMIKDTQEVLRRSGDIAPDMLDMWNATYKHYVPLHRVQEGENPFSGVGKGFAVRGNFGKRALGSKATVDDIIGNIVAAHERALIREEKMEVQKAVYGLAIKHPNPGFWMAVNPDALKNPAGVIEELRNMGIDQPEDLIKNLMAEPKERVLTKVKPGPERFDINGEPLPASREVVRNKINTLERYQDHVFTVRINGKDRYVFFNPKDPNAMRMARSLQNMDAEQMNAAMRGIGAATRWFANVNTQYNPIFGFVNLFRDVKGAMYNLSTTQLAGKQKEVAKNIMPAMRGIISTLRDERIGETGTKGEWAELYKDFRREGGQAGHRESLVRRQDQMRIIDEKLSQIKHGNARKAFGYVAGMLTDFNDMMENAVRLSAYKAALDKNIAGRDIKSIPPDELAGIKHDAAIIAKNLTVNFDKRGAFSQKVNSLYAFFNASVQGSARVLETLKGPAGKKIMAGGLGIGVMQSIMLSAAGYDENDIPEFVKEKNFIVPMPDQKYLSIPYPLGFNIFPNIGRITSDYAGNGFTHTGKHIGDMASTIADAFSPLGATLGLQTITPTVLDPLVAISQNQDAFGRPIAREDRATAPTPGWERSRDNASSLSQGIAYSLNLLTSGGEEHAKGFISPTADQLDYLAGQIGGGVSREILKAGELAKSTTTGEEVPMHRIPFFGRFVGDVGSPAATSQQFYTNITDMAEHENVVKGRMKSQGDVMGYYQDHPEARLWNAANNVENQINALNKRKRELESRGASVEALKQVENQKTVIMQRFNNQVKAVQEQ